jgi:opacity protein-like surface antigen
MLRSALVSALMLAATPAAAQIDGRVTPFVGIVSGGDAATGAGVLGIATGALGASGFGVEVDVAHTGNYDDDTLSEGAITSLMVSLLAARAWDRWHPFGVVGLGLIRTRACVIACASTLQHTELGFGLGGGLDYGVTGSIAVRGDLRYYRYFDTPDGLQAFARGPFDYWRTTVGVTYTWPLGQ